MTVGFKARLPTLHPSTNHSTRGYVPRSKQRHWALALLRPYKCLWWINHSILTSGWGEKALIYIILIILYMWPSYTKACRQCPPSCCLCGIFSLSLYVNICHKTVQYHWVLMLFINPQPQKLYIHNKYTTITTADATPVSTASTTAFTVTLHLLLILLLQYFNLLYCSHNCKYYQYCFYCYHYFYFRNCLIRLDHQETVQ